jgi:hypothetical protein
MIKFILVLILQIGPNHSHSTMIVQSEDDCHSTGVQWVQQMTIYEHAWAKQRGEYQCLQISK